MAFSMAGNQTLMFHSQMGPRLRTTEPTVPLGLEKKERRWHKAFEKLKLPSLHKVHDNVDSSARPKELLNANAIRVLKPSCYGDFSLQIIGNVISTGILFDGDHLDRKETTVLHRPVDVCLSATVDSRELLVASLD